MPKVLLIDDDELVTYALKRYLERKSHTVVTLQNGRKVTQTLHDEKPDIVLTDLIMPDSDGLEVIMTIRKSDRSIPIIAMSGGGRHLDTSYLDTARGLGANATLEKPFDESELDQLIHELTTTSES